jgi:peptide/nickel transport system substrate-binding protein
LFVAAPATPPSLDSELLFGKEAYDHVFNLNDRLTRRKQIPASGEPGGVDLAWQAENLDEITEPRMAEGWEITNGGRTYTFTLRRGWPSHAGSELTAADVKWTFERNFALGGITRFYNRLARIERPEDVKALDRYTVRIELAEPRPDLLLTVSSFWRAIVDSELAKSHATSSDPWATRWMKDHDAGFGPYKLAELSPGRRVVWAAHTEHPFAPKLDQITFWQAAGSADRLARLTSGHAQVAQYLLPADMQRVQSNRDLRLWNFQGYVVRQALSYATPYRQIVDGIYRGFAGDAHGPLADDADGLDPNQSPCTHDPGHALELLRRALKAVGVVYQSKRWNEPGFQVSTHRDVTGINCYGGEAVDWSKVAYTGGNPSRDGFRPRARFTD